MFELIYGNYNDTEEKNIYEDVDDAIADTLYRAQNFNYDFIVLKDVNDDRVIYEQFN